MQYLLTTTLPAYYTKLVISQWAAKFTIVVCHAVPHVAVVTDGRDPIRFIVFEMLSFLLLLLPPPPPIIIIGIISSIIIIIINITKIHVCVRMCLDTY